MYIFKYQNKRESTGLFIPQAGGYKELTIDVGNGSIVAVAVALDYHPDQTTIYTGWVNPDKSSDIEFVLLEIFSWRIICVFTQRNVISLSALKVVHFFKNFDPNTTFSSLDIQNILQQGVENNSLTVDFLSRLLRLKGAEPNGVYFADCIDYYLYFSSKLLVDFRTSNGLNQMAKFLKNNNPELLALYEQDVWDNCGKDTPSIIR